MPSISELKAASSQPRAGVWFDVQAMQFAPEDPGARAETDRFYLCVAPRSDRSVMRAARDLAMVLTERKGAALDDEETKAVGRSAHVVGWENVTDDDGGEIECTPDRFYQLLRDECPEYGGDVDMMVQLAAGRARSVEAEEEGK